MAETLLQHPILTEFVYPFLLMFFIVFAILEKTKVLGDKKQINALVAFVIGLIFVSALYPKMVVENMILFLTIGLIIVFVVLMLWGFIAGEDGLKFDKIPDPLKWVLLGIVIVAVVLGALWASGVGFGIFDNIFGPNTSNFWTNVLFIVIIAVALAVVIKSTGESK